MSTICLKKSCLQHVLSWQSFDQYALSRWLSVAEVYSEPYQTSNTAQPAFTCSKLIIETVEQGEICFKVNNNDLPVFLLLTLNIQLPSGRTLYKNIIFAFRCLKGIWICLSVDRLSTILKVAWLFFSRFLIVQMKSNRTKRFLWIAWMITCPVPSSTLNF